MDTNSIERERETERERGRERGREGGRKIKVRTYLKGTQH
jgi:hypothetical protein